LRVDGLIGGFWKIKFLGFVFYQEGIVLDFGVGEKDKRNS
jgi:hypothetical protein